MECTIDEINGICHIVDSYLIDDKADRLAFINEHLMTLEVFRCRSANSYEREWKAHNWLYRHNLFISSTKDVDLDIGESWWRRVGYFIISLLP